MLAVADQAAAGRPRSRCELADIFREYGEKYRRDHSLPVSHLRIMRAVERCRTASLGGHMQQCDSCGLARPAYNSCRNRHCPKCQSMAKAVAGEAEVRASAGGILSSRLHSTP